MPFQQTNNVNSFAFGFTLTDNWSCGAAFTQRSAAMHPWNMEAKAVEKKRQNVFTVLKKYLYTVK